MENPALPCVPSQMICYALRLTPGMEIKTELLRFIRKNNLKAPFILTCVGSVSEAKLRFAYPGDDNEGDRTEERVQHFEEHFEITSLVGTLTANDECHLHITLGRADGSTLSGHVAGKLPVYTTAEIVLGECLNAMFERKMDTETGFKELKVVPTE